VRRGVIRAFRLGQEMPERGVGLTAAAKATCASSIARTATVT
jgi:hypothetical protein